MLGRVPYDGGHQARPSVDSFSQLRFPSACPPPAHNLATLPRPAGATALVKLQAPQADELGFARSLAVREIGGTKCLVLQQDSSMGQISTVVLRGSTDQVGQAGRQQGIGLPAGAGATA